MDEKHPHGPDAHEAAELAMAKAERLETLEQLAEQTFVMQLHQLLFVALIVVIVNQKHVEMTPLVNQINQEFFLESLMFF